jgi:hypothetical protein
MLSFAPSLVAEVSIGDAYRGVPFFYQNDEETYLARMREVSEGHGFASSPFYHEYKTATSIMWPLGEYPYVVVSFLTRLPLETVVVWSKFFLPAVLFFMVYVLVLRLLRGQEGDGRWPALAGASLIVLAYDPIFRLGGLELSIWTRPVNPIMGALALFGVLLSLERLLTTKKLGWAAPIVLLAGLMVWYPFSWAITLSIIGGLWLASFFKQRRDTLKILSFVLPMSVLASLPYALYLIATTDAEAVGGSAAVKFGASFTHLPIMNKTLLLATIVFAIGIVWMRARKILWSEIVKTNWLVWSGVFLFAGWLVFNQQIITGRTVWPSHFVQYTKPLVYLVVVLLAWALLHTWTRARKALMGVLIGASFVNGILWSASVPSILEDYRNAQRYEAPITWLRKHAASPCVVLVSERVEYLTERIPAYTSCDVYAISWVFSGVPEERVQHNFFTRMRLLGVLPEHARSWMEEHPHEVRALFFRDWDDLFAKGTADAWFIETADRLNKQYAEFYAKDFRMEVTKYRLDYVISDGEIPYYVVDALGIRSEDQAGQFRIYRFQP